MDRRNNNQFIIFVLSVAAMGLVIESYMLGWEFWVPPLILLGILCCWILHIKAKDDERSSEVFYFVFACLAALFHGVHETSLFDVSIVAMLLLVSLASMDRKMFMHIFLIEYFIIIVIQLVMVMKKADVVIDSLGVSRLFLHVSGVLLVYLNCVRHIQGRIDMKEKDKNKDRQIAAYDEDMENFLSNISHELRTPVNVVNGMSDLLIKRNTGDEAVSIKDAGIRLSYQIEDILDYTESNRKKLILEEENYQITSLINDVVTNFRCNKDSTGLELVVNLSPRVPAEMKGDIKKLHKIFRHLLENAIKFTKEGGIYLSVATEETSYGANLCVEMIDTGCGMERLAIAEAAEGMYQGNKKRNRSSGGIGLGLSIVYGLTHRMGGFVRIESEVGEGTTVRVTIPQKIVDKTP
nr:HAMP domain-containing histidine kinase [Lachnospiraceae bacterium]